MSDPQNRPEERRADKKFYKILWVVIFIVVAVVFLINLPIFKKQEQKIDHAQTMTQSQEQESQALPEAVPAPEHPPVDSE